MKTKSKKIPDKYKKLINQLKWEKLRIERENEFLKEEQKFYEMDCISKDAVSDLFDSLRRLMSS